MEGDLPFLFLAAGALIAAKAAGEVSGEYMAVYEQPPPISQQVSESMPAASNAVQGTRSPVPPSEEAQVVPIPVLRPALNVPADRRPAVTADRTLVTVDASGLEKITIPALDVDTAVVISARSGDSWDLEGLRDNVAWLEGTSRPGLGGNTVLAGHITVLYIGNGPFRYLHHLKPGDEILVNTAENEYRYVVDTQFTVREDEVHILANTEDARLTLFTCTGWDSENERYWKRRVVVADLVQVNPLNDLPQQDFRYGEIQ